MCHVYMITIMPRLSEVLQSRITSEPDIFEKMIQV